MSFKLSVITATRNRKDFLPRCLDSVAAQACADKEHIVIDGGSTDGTSELLADYAARHPHLKWISEPDRGISHAMNKGLAMATGNAVGVIGDDDFYQPDVFNSIAEEFLQHPEAGIVSGHCAVINNADQLISTERAMFTTRRELLECWRCWGRRVMLPAPSTFIRRQVIDAVGGFDEADRYAMDYRHWIKITERFPVRILDRTLATFRHDAGTTSFSNNRQQWEETLAISKQYWGSKLKLQFYALWFSHWRHFHYPQWRQRLAAMVK
ncbi:MAG TPA: glycosyltransferase family 2 protein [Blastocatellia bacterium]|nr:glycosyltransferase family 2 protein [Blastocatellia bacterium]HMV82090.1 glycosyltransferase family 2 protein [Blastocatellia bacterium]HMY72204.1 glycosyltransferase family 2 protein [Blastocatellia bacterium]HNG34506.1 glycosyltransferase family 2 protein [Blastocatellia bacterium]